MALGKAPSFGVDNKTVMLPAWHRKLQQFLEKAVEPLGEARPDFDIFVDLAKRLVRERWQPTTGGEPARAHRA